MSAYKYILLATEGYITTLTINRPESRNALNDEALAELKNALVQVEKDDNIRVLIITGVGNSFVAGFDMKNIYSMTREEFIEYVKLESAIFDIVEHFEKPVVGAINGYAVGNGFELALACDIAIASEKARFSYPETKFGWLAPVQRLARVVGIGKLKEILYTGRYVDAPEAEKFVSPIKTVSGVLVAGPGEAHRFRPNFPFCDDCQTHECGRRMASVLGKA